MFRAKITVFELGVLLMDNSKHVVAIIKPLSGPLEGAIKVKNLP